jgi:hypothetical protein
MEVNPYSIVLWSVFATAWMLGIALWILQVVMVGNLNNRLPRGTERFSMMGRYLPMLSEFDRTYRRALPNDSLWRWRNTLSVCWIAAMVTLVCMMILRPS